MLTPFINSRHTQFLDNHPRPSNSEMSETLWANPNADSTTLRQQEIFQDEILIWH